MFNRPFNGNQNQNVSVNTNFYTSYSETAMLRVGAWNQQLSIRLQPAVGTNAAGVVQYAQDNSQIILTGIPQDNAIVLLEGYKKHVLPAIEKGEASPKVSISVSEKERRKLISIYYDGSDSYLEIAVNLNADGTTDESNVFKHKFAKRSYVLDYDYATGNGTEEFVESDLMNFMNKVEQTKDLTPFAYHSKKYYEAMRNLYSNRNNNGGGYQNNGGYNNYQQNAEPQNVSGNMDFLPLS